MKPIVLHIVNIGGFGDLLGAAVFQVNGSVTAASHSVERGLGLDVVGKWLPCEQAEDHDVNGR